MTEHEVRTTGDVIRLEGVGKRYWKLDDKAMLLRSILPFTRPERSELWALRGVDLALAGGETLGILGRNGSGKTTLLRLVTGISRPTEGRLRVDGRIAPLIGVGVGFQPEMSGRENVFVNGMLLGLTAEEVADRFDDIVAFAELRDFIDTPVKFYSSGMFVRLGFSVAVHCDPDVLLVDEVLAVGDLAYQLKCVERMALLQQRGCTIVIVSHSLNAIRTLCPRAILLHQGTLEYDGDTEHAIAQYHDLLSSLGSADTDEAVRAGAARHVRGGVTILERRLVGLDGSTVDGTASEPLELCVRVRFDEDVDSPLFGMNVVAEDGKTVYGVHSPVSVEHNTFVAGQHADVAFRFVPRLGGGTYRLTLAVTSADGREILASDQQGVLFYVNRPPSGYGVAELLGRVFVDGEELAEQRSFRLAGPTAAD